VRAKTPPDQWSTVRSLPAAFGRYEEALEMRPAGGRDKVALLRLRFELIDGVTRLVDKFGDGLNVAQRALYPDPELPDLAVVLIQSVGAGLIQGDRIRIEIEVGEGARALVTTQAATKLHEMSKNYATQRIDVTVGKDAYLELLMDPLIPCKGSRLYTELNFTVDPSSVLVYMDEITSGRVAYGESFIYDLLYTRMRCTDPEGRLIAADTAVLEPAVRDLLGPGLLQGMTEVGTMFVIAPERQDNVDLAGTMHDRLSEVAGIEGSASAIPERRGVYVRVLGTRVPDVEGALHRCWAAARRQLLGVGVTRVYATKHGFDAAVSLKQDDIGDPEQSGEGLPAMAAGGGDQRLDGVEVRV
jgi:urease accessory protein